MHLTSVLLPAPFSPSSACTVPGRSAERDVVERGERAEALGHEPAEPRRRSGRRGARAGPGGVISAAAVIAPLRARPACPARVRVAELRADDDGQRQHVRRGVEEVVPRRDADRLQRGTERARAAEQERRVEAAHRIPAREDHERDAPSALGRSTAPRSSCRGRYSDRNEPPTPARKPPAMVASSPHAIDVVAHARAPRRRSRRRCARPAPSACVESAKRSAGREHDADHEQHVDLQRRAHLRARR